MLVPEEMKGELKDLLQASDWNHPERSMHWDSFSLSMQAMV